MYKLSTVCMVGELSTKRNGDVVFKQFKDTTIGTVQQTAMRSLSPTAGYTKLRDKVKANLRALHNQISYIATLPDNLKSFRISSNLLPMHDHPEFASYYDDELNSIIAYSLARTKRVIDKHNIRVGTHPDKFTVINSTTPGVAEKSLVTLRSQMYWLSQLTTPDAGGTINVHLNGRGTELPDLGDVHAWLTLENDDIIRHADIHHTLAQCERYGLRMVYDMHHDLALTGDVQHPEGEVMHRIRNTWGSQRPLFHISASRDPDATTPKGISPHSDYIDDPGLVRYAAKLLRFCDLDVEAKMKNLAVQDFYKNVHQYV